LARRTSSAVLFVPFQKFSLWNGIQDMDIEERDCGTLIHVAFNLAFQEEFTNSYNVKWS
jgi:hypothetical protein